MSSNNVNTSSASSTTIAPEIEAYKAHLVELVNKSQDSFETQLSYISAGALSISIAFISDVVGDLSKTIYEGFLLTAWILMGITLLLNLLSHVYTSNCHNKTIDEIRNNRYDTVRAQCRHDNIQYFNYLSISTLILGIASLILFIGLNI